MAGKDEKDVVLPEDGVVEIDISDAPELAAEPETDAEPVVVEQKKPAVPRVRLADQQGSVRTPAVDEAAQALTAAKTTAENEAIARRAAEQTAVQERLRREAAERSAQQHRQEADDARASAEQTQMTLIDNGIEAAQREVTALEAQLANALESGDFKGAASSQTKLGMATAALDRLGAQKDAIANAPKKPTVEGRVESPVATSTPQEQYLSQFSPEAQTWLRSHPECIPAHVGGNAAANAKMMQGHYAAIGQNITPNTPDYFRVIEEHTGHRQPVSRAAEVIQAGQEQEQEVAPAQRTQARTKAQPSAPVSRDPPAANGGPRTSRTVTLTKDQQDMAKVSFPHLKPQEAFAQYARNLVELEAEGKLGRVTH